MSAGTWARTGSLSWALAGWLLTGALGCGSAQEAELAPAPPEPDAELARDAALELARTHLGEATDQATRAATATAGEVWASVQDLYRQAKEAGDTVPDDVIEWTKSDLSKIGDWEYRIESLPADRDQMQTQLNEWGADRWEAYWVELDATGYTVHLKRPARSYLRLIPVGDVLKALPNGGGAGN